MVNKVILVGNVGKDPEVKYLDSGIPFARFPLATSETYKDKTGTRQTRTEWHNIVLWRGLAEVAEKYIKKGNPIYIEGKITNRSYEKDGVTKYFTEIVGNEMKMLGSKNDNNNNQEYSPVSQQVSEPNNSDIDTPTETDDLPF